MRITFELAEPEELLRFLDEVEPSASHTIPQDVAMIADAIEARLTRERLPCMSTDALQRASDGA